MREQARPYDEIAAVYEFLVPDALLTPAGSAAAFAGHVEPGARVLDCACGTGTLAVGLALRGCDVVATDASREMVARTARLADQHGAASSSHVHAAGREARRTALRAMAATLRRGGLLVVTSRAWEQVRAAGSRLQVAEQLVVRDGRRGLAIHSWAIPERWDEPHFFDVAVALVGDDGRVETHRERFAFWPFTEGQLREDLRAAGLEPLGGAQVADKAGRYLLTASRR